MTAGFSERVEMGVPAQFAFDVLADPATATVIDPAIREYRPDTVPMSLGTRTLVRFRMWGLPVRAESVVRDWEPGTRMVMESERPSRPVRVTATHSFEALADDRSAYTWSVVCVPTVPLASPAARVLIRFLRSNAVAQQRRFAAEAERRWATR